MLMFFSGLMTGILLVVLPLVFLFKNYKAW